MKRRPWPLIILAFFHFIAPLGNIIVNSMVTGLGMKTYLEIKLSTQPALDSVLFFVLPPLAGLAIYICKKWSFWLYLGSMLMMLGMSFYHWDTSSTMNTVFLFLISLADLVIVGYFFIPDVKKIYFDPRLRWWETKPRFHADLDCSYSFKGRNFKAHIVNISETGLFLKAPELPSDSTQILIEFTFHGIDFKIPGETIHHQRQNEMGVGVKFTNSQDSKKPLRKMTQKLMADGKQISNRLPTKEDSLSYWMKSVLKGNEGLVPKTKK